MKINIALLTLLTSSSLMAGTSSHDAMEIVTPSSTSSWWLNITPYGWLTATEGDMGVAGRIAPVDISFQDTLENLDFAFMLAMETGFDRWAFGIDAIYGAFTSDAALPSSADPYTQATVDFDQFFARVHVGFHVYVEEHAKLTAFVGARYSHLSTEISLTGAAPAIVAEGSQSWVDPVIGMHGTWDLNERWFLNGGGDIGGFGVSSDLIWQLNLALGYRFTESLSTLIGYRGFGVDYSSGGFVVDTIAHGPVIGVSMGF